MKVGERSQYEWHGVADIVRMVNRAPSTSYRCISGGGLLSLLSSVASPGM